MDLNDNSQCSKDSNCAVETTAQNDYENVFYGVYIPPEVQVQEEVDRMGNVFKDKMEALKLVKKFKKARFKFFHLFSEALDFSLHGSEGAPITETVKCLNNGMQNAPIGEKSMPFRGPKTQDLVKLRKAIEAGDLELVHNTIWENPRYLVSSGDTPSILQEGSRYNALHVGAKAKNPSICELILSTVSNVNFIKLLYGDDSYQDADERAKMLLDLYLNTPDKGLNETPLHFAVKFGAVEVVELLVSFPQCDTTAENKFGQTPAEIICDRCPNPIAAVQNKIRILLQDNFYVPVLRSEDNCSAPVIGEAFSPTSPPRVNVDPLSPRMEIRAYAGPMKKDGAEKFRRLWKTPPRSLKFGNIDANASVSALKFRDPEKGLERIGKELASKWEVDWREYWPFLDSFVDLASDEGLKQFERYLGVQVERYCSGTENLICNSTPKSCTKIGSSKPSSPLIVSPISDLCRNFESCTLADNSFIKKYPNNRNTLNGNYLNVVEHARDVISEAQLFKSELSPLLCVEKSCQVFAHRISNEILNLLEMEYTSTTVILEVQVKQLQLLMASFMDDTRFHSVDFHLIHYRLGSLISGKLKDVLILEDEHNLIRKTLSGWLEACTKNYDCFSSDDESGGGYRQAKIVQKKCTSNNKQVMCLLNCILSSLTNDWDVVKTNINTEEECIEAWKEAKPCFCVWQAQNTRRSLGKKNSNSFKYSLGASDIQRRLSFDEQRSGDTRCNCDTISKTDTLSTSEEETSTEDEFFTPPDSPYLSDEGEDEFNESLLPDNDVFIEGNVPTKMDCLAFNAVKYAGGKLNPTDYPNIYKWQHTVNLYSEEERQSWVYPLIARYKLNSSSNPSTPSRDSPLQLSNNGSPTLFPCSKSWIRIIGANSPRKGASRNLTFNV